MSNAVLGIDVGGTFTDLVLVTGDGRSRVHKVLNRGSGAFAAVRGAQEIVGSETSVATIVHGTTVATNAVLERKGACTALVTTMGFRDVLEFQRQERSDVWDLFWQKPEPLIPRWLRWELNERLAADGSVVEPLDAEAAADAIANEIVNGDVESVAICLLHSYRNGEHEKRIAAALAARIPSLHISQSHLVASAYREYDRTSTTALNAYLGPVIESHMNAFESALNESTIDAEVLVMQSHGGVVPARAAAASAAALCLSGPAGGVLAAMQVAKSAGLANLICLDMGGTSTDVALVRDGRAEISYDTTVDGLTTILPAFRIETVGAGGGSLIEVDAFGLIQSGPGSAGANPGPACYGLGGAQATVTDAWCVVGALRPDDDEGRYLSLNVSAAQTAFESIAESLGTDIPDAAWQALRVTTDNMSRALRLVSVEQGHDPRAFALVSYGGAGGLHAALCAEELGMDRVLIPVAPGVFSAFGMVCADIRRHYVRTRIAALSDADDIVAAAWAEMKRAAMAEFEEFGIEAEPTFRLELDLRYAGQAHEVQVAVDESEFDVQRIRSLFDVEHARRFGFGEPSSPVEMVNIRLEATVGLPTPDLIDLDQVESAPEAKKLYLGEWFDASFWQRAAIPLDERIPGPAVVMEPTATTVVPMGWSAHRDEGGRLWLERH